MEIQGIPSSVSDKNLEHIVIDIFYNLKKTVDKKDIKTSHRFKKYDK